jgi:FkbM family methyltransferase
MLTSYAQNFEDIMLWRALGHLGTGFYIDVGANDPVEGSVSYGFYEQGWQGITVEPLTHFAELHRALRSRDQLLECAVDNSAAPIVFWEFPGTGLSTGIEAIARSHETAGRTPVRTTVPARALSSVFDLAGNRDIHWLKIDVEGMERRVVESWGQSRARPWIVVVESTMPGTKEPSPRDWEPMLAALGYARAYFDGLNSYYVHQAHQELASALAYGPSVLDNAQFSGASNSALFTHRTLENLLARFHPELKGLGQASLGDAMARLERLHASELRQLQSLRQEISRQKNIISAQDARIQSFLSSVSWGITRPIRAARELQLALGRTGLLADRLSRYRQTEVRRIANAIQARPKLNSFLRHGLDRAPWVKRRLRGMIADAFGSEGRSAPRDSSSRAVSANAQDLSPNTSLIAHRLNARLSSTGSNP